LQKGKRKKVIEESAEVVLRGESPMLKSARCLSQQKIILCILVQLALLALYRLRMNVTFAHDVHELCNSSIYKGVYVEVCFIW
jgi:hypothetical protein